MRPLYGGDTDVGCRPFDWEYCMADKLDMGDAFPTFTVNLAGGGTATVPDFSDAKYNIVLFYRGHW